MGSTRVRDIMQHKVVTIGESDSLSTAEDIMRLGRVRHMPVVHAGKLVGVVSERDLLRVSLSELSSSRHVERRAFLHVLEVGRAMSSPPVVIAPGATIEQAARVLAEHRIGCLPVVADEVVVGLVTATDVLLHFARRGGGRG
jgi:CBS domain-containing protein